jgi:hypothetical protein
MAVTYNYTNFGRFAGGLTVAQVPVPQAVGNVVWVDSNSTGSAGTFKAPFQTIEAALNSGLTANRGTQIHIKPGHSEEYTAAAGATYDIAGVDIVGHGAGAAMPQWKFGTAAGADVDITAADVRFFNCRFTAAFADVTSGIDISGNGTTFSGCRFDEDATNENWLEVINVADGVDDFGMYNCFYLGADASNNQLVTFAGTHENCRFYNNTFYHATAQTAATGFIKSTTQMLQMEIVGNFMHSEVAAVPNAFVELANATNTGFAIGNQLSSIDTDAAAADAVEAFDVTGLHSSGNFFTGGVADGHGIETFTTVEDLT